MGRAIGRGLAERARGGGEDLRALERHLHHVAIAERSRRPRRIVVDREDVHQRRWSVSAREPVPPAAVSVAAVPFPSVT